LVSGFGFVYQAFSIRPPDESLGTLLRGLIGLLITACIPAAIGGGLLRIERKDRSQQIAV